MHLTESSPLLSAPVLPLSWVPSFQFLDKSFKWLISFVLTTASLKGGWLPGASRDAHFWQPVPGLNNALMAGTMAQPSHEPPHKKEIKTGPHHTEKYQRRKNHSETQRRGERKWLQETLGHEQCSMKENLPATESCEGCSKQLGMRMLNNR